MGIAIMNGIYTSRIVAISILSPNRTERADST